MIDRRVAFLFLGETLLIPHLFPIVEALARAEPQLDIDLWVSTSMHEALLSGWTGALDNPNIRTRRAPGFRQIEAGTDGRNPKLPAKIPTLLRLAPYLARVPVAVCAERTSLWLPTLLPLKTRFIQTLHGAGSMNMRSDRRRKSAWRTLVSSERERNAFLQHDVKPDRIVVTGYVKAAFHQRTYAVPAFSQHRPVVLYTPHWQRHRSSWWDWGREVVRRIIADGHYNLIFAPHQRLVEGVPALREFCAGLQNRTDVHCDLDSFAMVDGSYTAAADIYLGDTSSQILEFLMRPRPCVFLNSWQAAWENDPSYAMWACGDVVSKLDDVLPTLARIPEKQARYAPIQTAYAADCLGDTSGAAPARAAAEILKALRR
jgi:hypothetical protein